MFLMTAVAAGLTAGALLGGRLSDLAALPLRAAWLLYVAIGLQLIAYPSAVMPLAVGPQAATVLEIASYTGLVISTACNLRLPGMAAAGAGMLANLAAILANGGHMPALPSALAGAGVAYSGVHANSVRDAHPVLPWLVDRWAAPGWIPWGNVFSIGDVLLATGVAVMVAAAMRPRPSAVIRRVGGLAALVRMRGSARP
jgi:hypothetical protein